MSIRTVYFDTSALRNSNWPRLSRDLETLLALATSAGVRLALPELVRAEAKAVYSRDLSERVTKAAAAIRDLKALVGDGLASAILPDALAASELWEQQHEDRCAQYSIVELPLPAEGLRVLAQRSVEHEPPFATEDTGFRDSLIALSIASDSGSPQGGILVAADEAFHNGPIAIFLRQAGCEPFRTVRQALDALRAEIHSTAVQSFNERSTRLIDAGNKQLNQFTSFLRSHLDIPYRRLTEVGRILQIDDIVARRVTYAYVPFDESPELTTPFETSLDVEIEVHTLFQPVVIRPEPTAKLGQPVEERIEIGSGDLEERQFTKTATVQARATAIDDTFELEFIAAQFGSTGDQLVDALVKNELMSKGYRF